MTLTHRTHCQDHNGIVHIASRITHHGAGAYAACGRDVRISSHWRAGVPGAPAVLVTCKRCLAEVNTKPPQPWTGDLFDRDEPKGN